MTTPTDPDAEPGKDANSEELQADIERTRERLAGTVEELSERFDVKSRARGTLRHAGHRVGDAAGRFRRAATADEQGGGASAVPAAGLAAVAVAATVVALVAVVRRRPRDRRRRKLPLLARR